MYVQRLKKNDFLLLTQLRRNSRTTLTDLSRKTRMPVSTIFDKVRNFEMNLVTKFTSLLDFAKFGYYARAHVILKVSKTDYERLREFLSNHQNVNSLYKINNGFDFQVELVFRQLRDLEDFIITLSKKFIIKQKEVYYILDDIKREAFFTEPAYIDIIDSNASS